MIAESSVYCYTHLSLTYLWECSLELVKQRALEKFIPRTRCKTMSGFKLSLQGT